MSGLLVVGAGGHGRVVADVADAVGHWREIAFLDDGMAAGRRVDDWLVLGSFAQASEFISEYRSIVVAIGNNAARLQWLQRYRNDGFELACVIHPAAVVSRRAMVAGGTVVFPNAVVNIGANIGLGCIINTAAVVEHDCNLGDCVHLSPNASLAGQVSVGACSWVGAGAVIRQQISVGENAVIGAGAAVVENLAGQATYVGVPARPI